MIVKNVARVIDTPEATVVIIDVERLEREVLKQTIQDEDVPMFLPFQTALLKGSNYVHIVNRSAYNVETQHHVIGEGATLCARGKKFEVNSEFDINVERIGAFYTNVDVNLHPVATCPGCLAKAKNIVVTHLLNTPSLIRES